MTIESKKELLKYIVLNESFINDKAIIYSLLLRNYFDESISKISDESFIIKIENSNEISAKQFIYSLNKFIVTIKKYFFNVYNLNILIDKIIEPNIIKINNYLCSKNLSENEQNEIIYKILISNFIENIKYIPSIKNFLTEQKIPIKNVDDYNLNESYKILILLSDLVFCQRGLKYYDCIFESINLILKSYETLNQNKRQEKYKEKFLPSITQNYDYLFESYQNKKKYLKYFH